MGDKARIGDWISFYREARITIAEVRYIRERKSYAGGTDLLTDIGAIDADAVLEIRHVG
jgi:hypothetical protein